MDDKAQDASGMTLERMLDAGASWLARRGVADARLLCEWLAASMLRCRRTALPLGAVPPPEIVDALRSGMVRLAAHEPVQYVIGDWDFRMLTLKTDRRALIPRPETEGLVQMVLDEPRLWPPPARRSDDSTIRRSDDPTIRRSDDLTIRRSDDLTIYDVGTGTGAIALSLAYERPQCRMVAVDCEEAALSLARENAARLGLEDRVSFVLGRYCAGAAPASLDAVVSNPPYIESAAVDALPPLIRDHEPRTALDGGADGLAIIRNLVHDAAIALKKGGFLFMEIGEHQGPVVLEILEGDGFAETEIKKDLNGLTRYAKGRIV